MRSDILTLILFLLVSCSQGEKSTVYVDLSPEKLNMPEGLSLYQMISVGDSSLIATVLAPGEFLVKVPLESDSKVETILKTGRGPFEVPTYSPVLCHDDTIHVLYSSVNSFNSLRIPLTRIHDCQEWTVTSNSCDKDLVLGMSFDLLSNRDYIASSSILGNEVDHSVLHRISGNLSSIQSLPFWPEDGYTGPVIPKKSLYLNSKIRANGSKVMYVADEGKYAAILDIGKNPVTETLIYSEYPSYTATPDGFNWRRSPDSALGCYAFATDGYIYLAPNTAKLLEGKYVPETFKGYPPYFVDEIDVFNWEGKYIHTLCSSIPFCNFWIDEEDTSLYFLTIDLKSSYSEVYRCEM